MERVGCDEAGETGSVEIVTEGTDGEGEKEGALGPVSDGSAPEAVDDVSDWLTVIPGTLELGSEPVESDCDELDDGVKVACCKEGREVAMIDLRWGNCKTWKMSVGGT